MYSQELSNLVLELYRRGEESSAVEEDKPDLDEEASECIRVDYEYLETTALDFELEVPRGVKFSGLDASVRILKFPGVDLIVSAGALVGSTTLTVPGSIGVRNIGVKIRYVASPDVVNLLKSFSDRFYTCSRFVDYVFDGTFSEDVARDEIRITIENALLREWNNDGYLLLDGPIFPLPRLVSRPETKYGRVYLGLIRERVSVIRERGLGSKVVAIVKRVSRSKYLSCVRGLGVTDDHAALMCAEEIIRSSKYKAAYVGDIMIELDLGSESYRKYAGYVVIKLGSSTIVFRIEALDQRVLEDVRDYIASLTVTSGVPVQIMLSDRISKRLCAAIYMYLAYALPLTPTYESLEAIGEILSYLAEG